jgi:hypothetical protein
VPHHGRAPGLHQGQGGAGDFQFLAPYGHFVDPLIQRERQPEGPVADIHRFQCGNKRRDQVGESVGIGLRGEYQFGDRLQLHH